MVLNVRRMRDRRRCRNAKVWLNGRDVTHQCFYADGRRGVVRLYSLNADGKKFVTRPYGETATEEQRGRVVIQVATRA